MRPRLPTIIFHGAPPVAPEPELLPEGRRLRGKTGYVVCTSVGEDPAAEFIGVFSETFAYHGMRYGGANVARPKACLGEDILGLRVFTIERDSLKSGFPGLTHEWGEILSRAIVPLHDQ